MIVELSLSLFILLPSLHHFLVSLHDEPVNLFGVFNYVRRIFGQTTTCDVVPSPGRCGLLFAGAISPFEVLVFCKLWAQDNTLSAETHWALLPSKTLRRCTAGVPVSEEQQALTPHISTKEAKVQLSAIYLDLRLHRDPE